MRDESRVATGGAPHEGAAAPSTVLLSSQRIRTPCPSCGSPSLFVGEGGHLTCAVLKCKEPGVEAAVDELHGKAHDLDTLAAAFLKHGRHIHDPEKHSGRSSVPLCCACFKEYNPPCSCGLEPARALAVARTADGMRATVVPRNVIAEEIPPPAPVSPPTRSDQADGQEFDLGGSD